MRDGETGIEYNQLKLKSKFYPCLSFCWSLLFTNFYFLFNEKMLVQHALTDSQKNDHNHYYLFSEHITVNPVHEAGTDLVPKPHLVIL
jgi:hypothetical protein